jgi:hypothetical protein
MVDESRRALAYAAALAAFTVCVFAPGQVYFHNVGEFSFSFAAVLSWLLPLCLLTWGLALAAAWWGPAPRRAALSALLLGGGVAAWLQSSVLLWDLGPLDGRPLDWTQQRLQGALDSVVWAVALAGAWRGRRWLLSRTRVAAGALMTLQALTLATLAGTASQGKAPPGDFVVDTSHRVQFSRGRNVVVLLLDTFQSDAFARMLEREPTLAERLDGFTFHRDALGGFPSTYPSVPLLLTGRAYDNRQPIRSFVDEVFRSDSALPLALRRAGYRVELYPMVDQSVSLDEASVSNLSRRLGVTATEFYPLAASALFRAAPMPAKRLLFEWVSGAQSFSGLQGNIAFWKELESETRVDGPEPAFKFIHLPGAHAPYVLDEQLQVGPEREGLEAYERHARGALELALRTVDRLKGLGVYEDSLWVIAGDHGHPHGGQLEQATPLLLTRLPGGHGKLVTSDAPVSLADVPASVAAVLGVALAPAPETLPVLTAPVHALHVDARSLAERVPRSHGRVPRHGACALSGRVASEWRAV